MKNNIISPLTGFIEDVSTKLIHSSKHQLRDDPKDMVVGLMASIEEKGLLQPIVVRPDEEGFETITGNRQS